MMLSTKKGVRFFLKRYLCRKLKLPRCAPASRIAAGGAGDHAEVGGGQVSKCLSLKAGSPLRDAHRGLGNPITLLVGHGSGNGGTVHLRPQNDRTERLDAKEKQGDRDMTKAFHPGCGKNRASERHCRFGGNVSTALLIDGHSAVTNEVPCVSTCPARPERVSELRFQAQFSFAFARFLARARQRSHGAGTHAGGVGTFADGVFDVKNEGW